MKPYFEEDEIEDLYEGLLEEIDDPIEAEEIAREWERIKDRD